MRMVVNQYTNEVDTIDVLYAINAKKEELAAIKSPRFTAKPLSVTSSTISISNLLDLVNKYFPDVLPEDVLRHYGYDARPDGDLGGSALFQERNYSYESLTSKPDMKVKPLATVSQNEIAIYKQNTQLFAKQMRKSAAEKNNKNNTQSATYLYCNDLGMDVKITRDSFKHGAARMDGAYIAACKSLADVLENAIVVNELSERENTEGGYVLLCLAENIDSYVVIRSVINKKTWKLEDYNELYAIKKKSIKKEDVGLNPPHYIQSNGYGTSSTISIVDFLSFVNDQKIANSVLPIDVVQRLNSTRGMDELFRNGEINRDEYRERINELYKQAGKAHKPIHDQWAIHYGHATINDSKTSLSSVPICFFNFPQGESGDTLPVQWGHSFP